MLIYFESNKFYLWLPVSLHSMHMIFNHSIIAAQTNYFVANSNFNWPNFGGAYRMNKSIQLMTAKLTK